MRRPAAPLACSLLLLAGLFGGCGAAAQHACSTPVTVREMSETLDGAWSVRRWDDVFDGTLIFHGNEIQANSTGTSYRGRWSVETQAEGRIVLRIRMSEATVDSLRQVYATPTELSLTLVFPSRNEVIALQEDGAWTRWERIIVPAPATAATAPTHEEDAL